MQFHSFQGVTWHEWDCVCLYITVYTFCRKGSADLLPSICTCLHSLRTAAAHYRATAIRRESRWILTHNPLHPNTIIKSYPLSNIWLLQDVIIPELMKKLDILGDNGVMSHAHTHQQLNIEINFWVVLIYLKPAVFSLESPKWGAGCCDPGWDSYFIVRKGGSNQNRWFYWHTADTLCHNTHLFPCTNGTSCNSLTVTVIPCIFLIFIPIQWLKQIDNTEAALTQKMIDLENDKVILK